MKRLPFRRRLTVWSTLVAAVSIVICGTGAVWFAYRHEVLEIDTELRAESAHFFTELNNHGGRNFDWRKIENEMREWLPSHRLPCFMEIRSGEKVRWRSRNLADTGFALQGAGWHDVRLRGNELRLLISERDGVTFAIAADHDQAETMARTLALALLAGFPLALAFAWFGGRRLAGLAVGPVVEITAATERVTAERLNQRVPVPPIADEIQHLARVLNTTLDRLEQSYQQALRFSGDASHELKTPLTVLRSSIELLLDSTTLGENDREAIGGLLEQTRRLTSITTSLLLLARADAGCLTLDLRECDLAAMTEACVEDTRIVAEQRGLEVECLLPRVAHTRVDALRFAQIVSNLLDNAVKYNQANGKIRVMLSAEEKAWRLSVANTCNGIAPEHRAHLFERFFRAEHTAEEPGHGLGLGLARELARAHGGEIALARSENGWIEFAVTLPRQDGVH